MTVAEIVERIAELPDADFRTVQAAVEQRVAERTANHEEEESLRRLIAAGLVTTPIDRSRATPDADLPDLVEIDGPPLSEQIIEERR